MSTVRRLLVTVAHPDDETFGCGSLLAHASALGVETAVVCATRGEAGEPAPGSGVLHHQLGEVREAELRAAAALLGVARVDLLGYTDSGVDGEPAPGTLVAASLSEVASKVATFVELFRPDVVVTLAADDGHRDHAAIRDATLAAVQNTRWRPERTYLWCLPRSLLSQWTSDPTLGTADELISTVIDTRSYIELRRKAIAVHASQVSPYESMSPELAEAFFANAHLVLV